MRPACSAVLTLLGLLAVTPVPAAQDGTEPEVPRPLAPFAHLVGAWKGQAIPSANRLRGWPERHVWSWKFTGGRPSGLTVELADDKTLRNAVLSHDPTAQRYRLEGTGPDGKPVLFLGALDARGQVLTLDRQGPPPPVGLQRLTLRLHANQIRYTLLVEAKPKGAPQYNKLIDVNLGKEGEAFAAGSTTENLPRCILTGGAATLTVVHNGKSYPVCCTGCRDEFLANPEKYINKAQLRAEAKSTQ